MGSTYITYTVNTSEKLINPNIKFINVLKLTKIKNVAITTSIRLCEFICGKYDLDLVNNENNIKTVKNIYGINDGSGLM